MCHRCSFINQERAMMKQRRKSKKRPCRICRKWFKADPRVGERQKTCGSQACQDKWHAKKCAEWNGKNPSYFREIYLSKKLVLVESNCAVAKSQKGFLMHLVFAFMITIVPSLLINFIGAMLPPLELLQDLLRVETRRRT